MGKRSRVRIALLLVVALVALCVPCGAFADGGLSTLGNGDPVLSGITYKDAKSTISGTNITVTMPYGTKGNTVNLADGMEFQYSSSTTYGAIYANWPSGSDTTVGTTSAPSRNVALKMIYKYNNDPQTEYSTTYTISVVEAAAVSATFSGTVSARGTVAAGYTFTAKDFNDRYTANDGGALSKIKIIGGANPTFGKLKLGSRDVDIAGQEEIPMSNIGQLKFVATAAGSGSRIYYIRAFDSRGNPVGDGSIDVTILASTTMDTLTYSITQTGKQALDPASINTKFKALTGTDFHYVKFTSLPSSSYGTLYLGYSTAASPGTAVTTTASYFRTSTTPLLSAVTFVPTATYSGTVSIPYTAYDTAGNSCTGTIQITVTANSYPLTNVTYTTNMNTRVAFNAGTFNTYFYNYTRQNLSYVQFRLPDNKQGTLYVNTNTQVTEGASYYYSGTNPLLGNVSFVPTNNYAGKVTIYYTAYSATGLSHNGRIEITVTGSAVLNVSVAQDEVLSFSASNFNSAFSNATSRTLSYVRFTLPSSSYGTLRYNYVSPSNTGTAVNSSTNYYRTSGTNLLSNVSFVPKANWSGTFTLNWTGYDSSNYSYSGTMTITVTASNYDISTLTYSVSQDEKFTFNATDMNTAFKNATGDNLNNVRFSLPSSSYGTLYYQYSTSSSTKVSSSTRYYRSSSPLISDVSFVPKSNYTGTVSLLYTGYDAGGSGYSGKISITVTGSDTDIDTLTYSVKVDEPLIFSASAFNTQFKEVANTNLYYVRFTLPSSNQGTLYYQYTSANNYKSRVTASTNYYRTTTAPLLADVTFVPYSGYSGTVNLSYVGYDSNGNAYSGKVKITVGTGSEALTALTNTVKADAVLGIPITAINSAFKTAAGTSSNFNYLRFTLPSSAYGTLYYGYASASSPGSLVTANTSYYYNSSPYAYNVVFVPKSTYAGTFNLAYAAYDSSGEAYSGIIKVTVTKVETPTASSKHFTDVTTSYSWAAAQIDYLYEKNIVTGTSSSKYSPANNITRGDFILMLYRAFNLKGSFSSNFSDVPTSSYYYTAIGTAKALGIAKGGDDGKFNPKGNLTRQDAAVLVDRTLDAVYKSLTNGSSSDLASFTDRSSVSSYAQDAVSTLVRNQIITGYADKTFRPKGNLTRAEMAVILYRVLT